MPLDNSRWGVQAREYLAQVREQREQRCADHPAYEADYCPVCGTARIIGSKP